MKLFFLFALLASYLSAFSTTDIQYLYGNFEGPTFLDTQTGAKQTVTAEHFRTWDYGDLYMFVDYAYAKNGLQFSNLKNDLYGEFSPRISLNKITNTTISDGIIKEWYCAFQYNRSQTYRGWLYGVGIDLNIPGFSIFGLNVYRKIQNIGSDTYQLSSNYYLPLSDRWHFEGFSDWTTIDFLTQNQVLFNIAPSIGITAGKLEVGTEWHYYHENTYHQDNDVFQAMVKYTW
jgi:nucleoside-specific outer membrane channel protein Tsx